jgi:hypothetical protein
MALIESGLGIPSGMLEALLELRPATVLEIGTGDGTSALTEHFNVVSIEHDSQYHKGTSRLLEVPLKSCRELDLPIAFWKRFPGATEWYDPAILLEKLRGVQYDAILIDGPNGGARRAAMWHFFSILFRMDVPVIIDDAHRTYDWQVAVKIAEVKDAKEFVVVRGEPERLFAVIQ